MKIGKLYELRKNQRDGRPKVVMCTGYEGGDTFKGIWNLESSNLTNSIYQFDALNVADYKLCGVRFWYKRIKSQITHSVKMFYYSLHKRIITYLNFNRQVFFLLLAIFIELLIIIIK